MNVTKTFCDGEHNFFSKMKEGCKVSCAKILLAGLLGSQYLLEILKIIKYSEHVVKMDVSKNICHGKRQFFSK